MNETRPHHDNMHPCDKYHSEDPQTMMECHQAVESCYMMHSEEGHEEMMATCVHDGCVAWFNENPTKAEEMNLEMSVEDTCWGFVSELHEHYNGHDDDHEKMHPCNKHHSDNEEHQGECHEAVNSCYMMHSEEGHEEMMASCIHDKCTAWFAENPEEVAKLDGESADDACWSFLSELDEHYNGKDDHHHEKMHPCDKHHMDNEEHQSECHEAVNSCWMEHSDEGHEEMMASCVHAKCATWFAENPEEVAKLDGESIDDACSSFLEELHEHYDGQDDHHENMHPCDKEKNAEEQLYCHESVNSCWMDHSEEGHEEMLASCIQAKCTAWFAENPDQVEKLDGSVDEACSSFLEELYHYYEMDHHHDDDEPSKPEMELNKHHPCNMMQSDNQEGCVESYQKGVRKCENGDDKKCLEKQCKKSMKNSEKEWGMMHFKDGGEIEDHKQFCKDFVKQHFKFQKKGGDEEEKLSKHHPCQLMPKESHADCAKDYEKVYSKCWGKDSSNNKMKKCLKKECEKKLVDGEFEGSEAKDLCTRMEKQSRKYQKKMNKD